MQSLNRVLARAHNSAKFTHYSCGDTKLMQCSKDEAKHLPEGFLRAALAEFASMEDVLKLLSFVKRKRRY